MEITLLQQSGMSAGLIALILVIYRVLKTINGKRVVSQCCGKKTEIGFTVENMSPIVIQNPMPLPPPLLRSTNHEVQNDVRIDNVNRF